MQTEQKEEYTLTYAIEVEYLDTKPPSAPQAKIEFYKRYSEDFENLEVGQVTTQDIELINASEEA